MHIPKICAACGEGIKEGPGVGPLLKYKRVMFGAEVVLPLFVSFAVTCADGSLVCRNCAAHAAEIAFGVDEYKNAIEPEITNMEHEEYQAAEQIHPDFR